MKKNVGIWLDKRMAHIVALADGKENLTIVVSDVEEFHPKGGSGSRMKGGPQDVVQDSKYLERENHQYKRYFNEIIHIVRDADAIVVFGPAETGERLYKVMQQDSQLALKLKGVKRADSITDNQVKAWVRKFFAKLKD